MLCPADDVVDAVGVAGVGDLVAAAESAAGPAANTSEAWRALAHMSGVLADELFDPLCFIENPETDSQVAVLVPTCLFLQRGEL